MALRHGWGILALLAIAALGTAHDPLYPVDTGEIRLQLAAGASDSSCPPGTEQEASEHEPAQDSFDSDGVIEQVGWHTTKCGGPAVGYGSPNDREPKLDLFRPPQFTS